MRRLLALILLAGSLLAGCSSDDETTPCENHGRVAAITFSDPKTLSFSYRCQDGHNEYWTGGEKTEG